MPRRSAPVGAERKEAVQNRLFTGLSASWHDGSWALHAAGSLLAHSLSQVFSNASPVTRQPRSHYPVLGFPIWHIFMPGRCLVLPAKKKVGSTIAREQSPTNVPRTLLSICDRQLSHPDSVASVQNRVMYLVCAPFQALNVAAYRSGV